MLTNGTYSMGEEFARGLFSEIVEQSRLVKYAGVAHVKDSHASLSKSATVSISNIPVSSSLSKTKQNALKNSIDLVKAIANEIDTALFSEIVPNATVTNATTTAIRASNIFSRLTLANKNYIDSNRFRVGDGVLFINPMDLGYICDTDQCKNLDTFGNKLVTDGKLNKIFGFKVEVVPTETLGTSVNFILFRAPEVVKMVKIRIDSVKLVVNDGVCDMQASITYDFDTPEEYSTDFGYFIYADTVGA